MSTQPSFPVGQSQTGVMSGAPNPRTSDLNVSNVPEVPQGTSSQPVSPVVLKLLQTVKPQGAPASTAQPTPKANASALAGTTPVKFEGWTQFNSAADTLTTRAQITIGGPKPSGAPGFVFQARHTRTDNLEFSDKTTNQFRLFAGVAGKDDSLSYAVGGYNGYSFNQSGLASISVGFEGTASYTHKFDKLFAFNAWAQLNVGANFPTAGGQSTISFRADAGAGAVITPNNRLSIGIYPIAGYFSDADVFGSGASQSKAYAPYGEAALTALKTEKLDLKLIGRIGGEIPIGGVGEPALVIRGGFSVNF
jgi:hypothetical protein